MGLPVSKVPRAPETRCSGSYPCSTLHSCCILHKVYLFFPFPIQFPCKRSLQPVEIGTISTYIVARHCAIYYPQSTIRMHMVNMSITATVSSYYSCYSSTSINSLSFLSSFSRTKPPSLYHALYHHRFPTSFSPHPSQTKPPTLAKRIHIVANTSAPFRPTTTRHLHPDC